MKRSAFLAATAVALGLIPSGIAGAATDCRGDNFSPSSRELAPTAVYGTGGQVANPQGLVGNGLTRLSGTGSSITLDFGKDVAGIVSLRFAPETMRGQSVNLSFSESSDFINPANSDSSNGGSGPDGVLTAAVDGPGTYTVPKAKLRGGFRYLTLSMGTGGSVLLSGVSLQFTAAPAATHPDRYAGGFCSSDDLLNRIWYAGAYTVQLDTIAPDQGRVWGPPASGWNNSGLVGVGNSVLVDGAKRDRTIWPGDMGVSVLTDFASLGDAGSVRNSLTTLYQHQDASGALPYAGPQVNFAGTSSDTYNLWALIATADLYLYAKDDAWMATHWAGYKAAVQYALSKTDPRGLMLVTGGSDWYPQASGESVEANALLYHVLVTGQALASAEGDTTYNTYYGLRATLLQKAINTWLYDSTDGGYGDTYTTNATGAPTVSQDGNSAAVWFGVPDAGEKSSTVLATLKKNWTPLGSVTPEWGGIGTFPGSMEVYARLAAGDTTNGLDLIRREWGYMLNSPQGTGSTFWEGMTKTGDPAYNAGYANAPAGIYTSFAHGWATGPTGALSGYVLGIQPAAPGGSSYAVTPHPGDLRWARGHLRFPAGTVSVDWARSAHAFKLTVADDGRATTGTIAVPQLGSARAITLNGAPVYAAGRLLSRSAGLIAAHRAGDYVVFEVRGGGSRTFAWR